jgi:ribonuclease P protein component
MFVLDIIKSSTDITRVFKQGTRFGRGSSALILLENDEQHGQLGRVAFVAGKKLGNAVWRNRAKRRMRAAYQQLGGPWPGFDIVFIAGRNTADVDFSKLLAGYRKTLREAGVDGVAPLQLGALGDE